MSENAVFKKTVNKYELHPVKGLGRVVFVNGEKKHSNTDSDTVC